MVETKQLINSKTKNTLDIVPIRSRISPSTIFYKQLESPLNSLSLDNQRHCRANGPGVQKQATLANPPSRRIADSPRRLWLLPPKPRSSKTSSVASTMNRIRNRRSHPSRTARLSQCRASSPGSTVGKIPLMRC